MKLQKRDCGIKMKIVPYGAGWTDVYVDFGEEELYFIISHCMGDNFTDFMKLLSHMYPSKNDLEEFEDDMEYQYAVKKLTEDGYKTDFIIENLSGISFPVVYQKIPWKSEFTWDEEGACSVWHLEREPNEETNFILHIDIEIDRNEKKKYHYNVHYKELCYAVAKAYTEMLKKHGFMGYHQAVYSEDIQMRYLLFLKAYALDCMEVIETTSSSVKGEGDKSSLENELKLMLFDM